LEILNSFDDALEMFGVLGLRLEVNFFGAANDTDNTFHNTDRFMKAHGYELVDLTLRRYSLAALPSKFLYRFPAQTEFGRIFQGDALYIKDLAAPENTDLGQRLKSEQLLKLMFIFTVFNLPDCAAEIAINFEQRLHTICDIDHLLDLLAIQIQAGHEPKCTYHEWMQRFAANDRIFFSEGDADNDHVPVAKIPRNYLHSIKSTLSALHFR
jgi:hypothetical protein